MARDVWQKTITSLSGDALDGAQITVRDQQTNALSAIFDAQSGGSQRPNPFLTGADGVARFFAEPGFYKVTAFKDGFGTAEFIWNNLGDNNVRQDINSVAVGLTGDQTIAGAKTFTDPQTIRGQFVGRLDGLTVRNDDAVANGRGSFVLFSGGGGDELARIGAHYAGTNIQIQYFAKGNHSFRDFDTLSERFRIDSSSNCRAFGDMVVDGALNVAGSKNFRIDNPANPDEYLYHSAIESDIPRTQYVHHVSVGETLTATLDLPEWFQGLNGDTCTVFASPCKHFGQAYGEVVDGVLTITANAEGDYHVLIMAERSDPNVANWVLTEPKPEPEPEVEVEP